ncbi:MAG: OmpA family protein [Bacteroidales bacterium]|nr:OmpA family protein [Bacteroidales bacterium]
MKKYIALFLCGAMILSGCSSMSKMAQDALIGTGSGAAVCAGVGALIGKDGKAAAIGAAVGSAVGATAGAIIGKKMDQKAAELAALEAATVETVEDANGLEAIKVTFDSGILFALNKADLNAASKANLAKFASQMADMPETDITIYGHTDNTGSDAVNERLSKQRAESVLNYLKSCGIAGSRMTSEGMSYHMPVASNETAEGRAQNRRVEVYISANENMIKEAEAQAKAQ